MKRREFLSRAIPATVLPFAIGGFRLTAYARNGWLHDVVTSCDAADRILVVIQLSGGNDGLNTVIPIDQYDAIMKARANIAVPENDVLKLSTALGFNPRLARLKNVFNDGKLAIVQNVGYPNLNQSHF